LDKVAITAKTGETTRATADFKQFEAQFSSLPAAPVKLFNERLTGSSREP
jgi:hypothetical protein